MVVIQADTATDSQVQQMETTPVEKEVTATEHLADSVASEATAEVQMIADSETSKEVTDVESSTPAHLHTG